MGARSRQMTVGALFLASVVVLVAGVLWFKDYKLGRELVVVTVAFPSTSGLVKGDIVEVQGVPSGEVAAIRFEEGRALVVLELDSTVPITAGTRVVIENVGIMGQKMVAVYPGPRTAALFPPGAVLDGSYQPGIPQLMENLGGTLSSFGAMASRLDSLLASFDSSDEQSLHRTLANLDVVAAEMAALLTDSRVDMTKSLRNLNSTTESLKRSVEEHEDDIGRAFEGAGRVAGQLDTTLTSLSSTLASVDSTARRLDLVLARIERGDGSLGKLLNDDALHTEFVTTLREARTLLADIQAHPKKYVKLSLF